MERRSYSAAEFLEMQRKKSQEKKEVFNRELFKKFLIAFPGTQEDIASQLGVKKSTITNLKSSGSPSLELYKKICDLFEVDYNTFFL